MANVFSDITGALGRVVKWLMVAVLVPLAVGLLLGMLEQAELVVMAGASARDWIQWGFASYVGMHLLLYRPVPVFRASHRLFASLAVWLFGGQVASMEGGGGGGSKGKASKGGKGGKGDPALSGSPLVAFSPYVIPLYVILVCAAGWLLAHWVDRMFVEAPLSVLVGVTMAFHWLMTADDLQQQRARWHLETYLLAISLVFVLTLLIGGACLPWAIPEFSFVRALADGFSKTQAIYTTLVQRLFL